MERLLHKIWENKSLLLLIVVLLIFRAFYGLCINFAEASTQYLEDYTQIYLIGLKAYTSGIWPYWGPDISYTFSQLPGALQGLLVAIPFYIAELPEAPFILLNILSAFSLVFFAWYISKRITGIPKWFIYAWLLTAPWTINYSTTIINPSYVLAPAILFFISTIELLPIYKEKILSFTLTCFLIGFTFGWIIQIHLSWILLPFYILVTFYFLVKTKNFKTILKGLFYFSLGFLLIMSTVIPTLIKFGFVTGGSESTIAFNFANFKNLDIITRFIAFSTFEVRHFISGGSNGEKSLLLNNLWAAPFILILFIVGIFQTIYYMLFFFRKTSRPEFNYVKLFTIGSILLTYISYLFTIREIASYTFYLLLPVSFWFSFYCMEELFKKAIWLKLALFFILSGLIYHIALAKEYFSTQSLYSKKQMISQALINHDSRYFSYRRVANWEKKEREKVWSKSIYINSSDTILSYLNNFDGYAPEILPESLNDKYYISAPYSCQIDSVNPFSIGLSKIFKDIKGSKKIAITLFNRYTEVNDCILTVSISSNKKTIFWSGDKICLDSKKLKKWNKILITKELPSINDSSAQIDIYVWLPKASSKIKIQMDNFRIEFY